MFVFHPDSFLLPNYRISPFRTESIMRNYNLSQEYEKIAIHYFNNKFGENQWLITQNGREAIALAMKDISISNSDYTTILTPSNNLYISSCVTKTISNFSLWNRSKSEMTKLYLINHEFGYLYNGLKELVKDKIPMIEDCCTTFFSNDEQNMIGLYGTYSVYSFPKFFSIQIGGLLVFNQNQKRDDDMNIPNVTEEEKKYILRVVGYELSKKEEILAKRKHILNYATEKYKQLGFSLRFPNAEGIVPSVLLLNNNGIINDLNAHKEFLNKHGVQNSVFYGEDAFFVPCHQNMEEVDMDYFFNVTKQFLNK